MLHAQLGVSTMEEISMTDVMGDNEAQLTNLMELLPDRIDAKKQSLHPWPYKKNAPFQNILKKDSYFGRGKATQQLAWQWTGPPELGKCVQRQRVPVNHSGSPGRASGDRTLIPRDLHLLQAGRLPCASAA